MSDKKEQAYNTIRIARGKVIDAMVDLENSFDDLITFYFSNGVPEIASEIQYVFLYDLKFTLGFKSDVVIFILNKFKEISDPIYIERCGKLRKKGQLIKGFIEDLITKRNSFAHRKSAIYKEQKDEDFKSYLWHHKTDKMKPTQLDILINEEVTNEILSNITAIKFVLQEVRTGIELTRIKYP